MEKWKNLEIFTITQIFLRRLCNVYIPAMSIERVKNINVASGISQNSSIFQGAEFCNSGRRRNSACHPLLKV